MTDWTSRTVTTQRKEYTLPSPTNWTQVRQVLSVIRDELAGEDRTDDRVTIEARDDGIVFWYEVPDA